ncbi:hypothetical protein GQF01_00905 [Paenibacillus sp. 5J-6]|uniref:Uncharacterized protein n=1 Tax=Paenibacillus silvestris TaxID=2606219 RepID=A0A6L8URY1_9BACL|nr:hypothetical protein [Paenibacillus silvestris]MZQ80714.1 hypothetical protein [Paenibacillus silvestris]
MEIKQMVEAIVREMLSQQVKRPKVLYLFYDSTSHEAFTDHFIALNIHGIDHDLMFLDGEASCWLGKHKIECGGRGRTIASDEFAPAPIEVPLAYEGVVIPEIDLDNAARAALGMKGTIVSEIIFSTLVQNKFVLIGEDISGLKKADRRTLQALTLPTAYRNLFDYYKMELQMYGVEFAPTKELAEKVVGKIRNEKAEADLKAELEPSLPGKSEISAQPTSALVYEGKLISAEWVTREIRNLSFRSLQISSQTIISALAHDMLKDRGITIEYIAER